MSLRVNLHFCSFRKLFVPLLRIKVPAPLPAVDVSKVAKASCTIPLSSLPTGCTQLLTHSAAAYYFVLPSVLRWKLSHVSSRLTFRNPLSPQARLSTAAPDSKRLFPILAPYSKILSITSEGMPIIGTCLRTENLQDTLVSIQMSQHASLLGISNSYFPIQRRVYTISLIVTIVCRFSGARSLIYGHSS